MQGLYDEKMQEKRYLKGGSTYSCLAKTTYGIINGHIQWDRWADDKKKIYQSLAHVSVINLNKFGGEGRVNWKRLNLYAGICKPLTLKQLEILSPDIVICAGTTWFFDGILFSTKSFPAFGAVKCNGTLFVDTYHTCQTQITQEEYYEQICSAIH